MKLPALCLLALVLVACDKKETPVAPAAAASLFARDGTVEKALIGKWGWKDDKGNSEVRFTFDGSRFTDSKGMKGTYAVVEQKQPGANILILKEDGHSGRDFRCFYFEKPKIKSIGQGLVISESQPDPPPPRNTLYIGDDNGLIESSIKDLRENPQEFTRF